MKRNAVVIAGYYGFGNAGDELLLRSLVDQFRNQDPQCEIIVLSSNPEETSRHFSIRAVNRWNPWAWIGPFSQAKRLLLGGGGLLQESTGPWNHAYYLLLIVMAKLLGCATEVRSIGVDPIENRLNRWWTRWVFNHMVDTISVRDADSQRALEVAGVFRSIVRIPDLIFQLEIPKGSSTPSEKMGLAISPWPQRMGWDQDVAFLLDRISQQLNISTELLVFFPDQDGPLAAQIVKRCATPVVVREWQNVEDILGWMPSYQLVVGMRYHSLALAALAEKPFLGWGFQRKVRSLCRDLGQPMWTFERGWEADAVFRQISEAWRHREMLPHRYKTLLPALKTAAPTVKDIPRIYPSHV